MPATAPPNPPATPDFRLHPLAFFDHQAKHGEDAFRISETILCVADAESGKAILANPDGAFQEHSDFFHTRRGAFGPRETQVAPGRGARELVSRVAAERSQQLPDRVLAHLAGSSEWPDAGNLFLADHLGPALVTAERRHVVGDLVTTLIRRSVLRCSPSRRRVPGWLFRPWAFRRLRREVEARMKERPSGASPPRDLFDLLADAASPVAPKVRPDDLGELYMPFLVAIVGSIGFTLGWCLYLLGTRSDVPDRPPRPAWVVREALRLWPVAWQFLRHPARDQEIAGCPVARGEGVLVSPYLIHRRAGYWQAPGEFRPERWAGRAGHPAYIPFGWGPHTCAAAGFSLEMVEAILEVVLAGHFRVEARSERPFHGPALAPPPFRLDYEPKPPAGRPRAARRPSKGGDTHGQDQASSDDRTLHP